MTRTLAFVIAASVSVIGAVVAHLVTRPQPAADQAHTLIGEAFYPAFTDPTKATGIRVAAWNPNSNRVEQFEVRYQNGQWRIPSHNNYPADGKEQLARAAASAVGIVRGSLLAKGADPTTLERYGVVDPLEDGVTQGAGTSGTRITLFEGDEVVADYIVGRKFGDVAASPQEQSPVDAETAGKQSKEGRFYVRRPDEKQVYLAEVKIDVSTKFRDWIDKNLLDLTQGDLRKIVVNRYSIDEQQGRRIDGDRSELSRTSSADPWKLAGLDAAKEQVKTGVVSAMARALDNLQIIGVRKKPAALIEFFSKGTVTDVLQMIAAQSDMQQRGYFFTERDLLSNEGEVFAGTQDGVQYVLRFGEVFTGSDLEIEVGQSADAKVPPAPGEAPPSTDAKAEAEKPAADGTPPASGNDKPAADPAADTPQDSAAAAAETPAEAPKDDSAKRSRYVIVEALFDPTLLGPEPTAPVKPTPPAEATPAAAAPAAAAPASTDPTADLATPTTGQTEKPADKPPLPATPTSDTAPPAGANCDDAQPTDAKSKDATQADAPASPPATATPAAAAEPATPAADSPADAPAATAPTATSPPAAPVTGAASPATPAAEPVAPPAERPKTPQDLYQEALGQYQKDLEAYEARHKDYTERLKKGEERVAALNKRFAEWYYVISADVYDDLRVSREQLVEPVTPPADANASAAGTAPNAAQDAPATATQPAAPTPNP